MHVAAGDRMTGWPYHRAKARGWAIGSVKNDWKTVSLTDNRGPPGDVNTGEGNTG
jgi:hypothetical protein